MLLSILLTLFSIAFIRFDATGTAGAILHILADTLVPLGAFLGTVSRRLTRIDRFRPEMNAFPASRRAWAADAQPVTVCSPNHSDC